MIAPHSLIGGRYRVVKALGGGGMKLVYLAEDLRLSGRKCALAEMVDTFTSTEAQQQAVNAFQREADMLAQLSNEHIPRIFDRFSEGNHHFLVMEYIDGTTLEEQLKQSGGKLPPERVVGVALQVLDTLEYLHHLQPPVIYRDLKPSNIMVTADGEAKLIDFGIARHFHPLSNATMIGTQGYAPPEQYRGKVETRSDIYSLGATMHHAISGRDPAAEPPFSFPPLQKFAPDVDPRLASAVDQALAYDVGSRLRDAAEFKFRLFQISDDAVSASARGSAQNNQPGRTQLPLPLGDGVMGSAANPPPNNQFQGRLGVPPLGPSAGAPTVLSTNIEISCPQCTRRIPGDSRFCSYCACKLHLLAQRAGGAAPDDETVVLSGGHSPAHVSSPSVRSSVARNASAPSRRRRALRRPFLLLAVIFAAGVIAAELIKSALNNENPAPPGYRTGSDEGPDAMPRAPGEYSNYSDYDSAVMRSRLIQLRARLDTGGYSTVRFRLEGDTLILYGSVHSEYDRLAVQAICFATVGLTSLSDDLKVSDGDTED